MDLLLQLLANGFVNGALYAMLAVGFGLVWRSTGIFHVAYGALYVVSAYCFHTLVSGHGVSIFVALLLTAVFAVLCGLAVGWGFYRPFLRKKASPTAILIASLGLSLVIENLVAMVFGSDLRTFQQPIAAAVHLGPVVLTQVQVMQLIGGFTITALLYVMVRRLRFMKALWAMGDQPELIQALGLPIERLRALVFAASTVLAALAASLISFDVGIEPHTGIRYLLVAAAAVLVGGLGSYPGWIAGAVLLACLQSLVVWQFSSRWIDLVTFGVLILVLVLRPHGLLERQVRLEER